MNAVVRYIVRGVYHLWYDFHIEGEENVPEEEGFLIAANHRTYADPVLLTMPVKKPVKYMAKEELFKNPLFAAFIRGLGAFPIRRGAGDMGVINDTIERLKSFMCSDYGIAVGIYGYDSAVHGHVPVLAFTLNNGFGGEYPVSAPSDRIVTFKGEISLYAYFSQLCGVKLVNIFYQLAVHSGSLLFKSDI